MEGHTSKYVSEGKLKRMWTDLERVPCNYGHDAASCDIVADMVRIQISMELEEDEYGPRATYLERFVLPRWFAEDASDAHAKLLTLLVTARYVELPQHDGPEIPRRTETVRELAVWEGG